MQFNWQELKHLLVVFVGVETLITSLQPALRRLRETLAHTEITLLIQICPSSALKGESYISEDIRPLLAWVDRVISYTSAWQDAAREKELVEKLRQMLFDAAIIFTDKEESPYPLAYLSYLAGIPIRVGQSREFAGGVLSHWLKPALDELPDSDRHLYLLDAAGFPLAQPSVPIIKH